LNQKKYKHFIYEIAFFSITKCFLIFWFDHFSEAMPEIKKKSSQNGTFWPLHVIWKILGHMTLFEAIWKCHSLTLSKICIRLRPAPSKCLSERINWIISRISCWISKILFVYGSYESLAMLEGKTRKSFFFYGKITVWWPNFNKLNYHHQHNKRLFHKKVLLFFWFDLFLEGRAEVEKF
jgi:hypothetical protein